VPAKKAVKKHKRHGLGEELHAQKSRGLFCDSARTYRNPTSFYLLLPNKLWSNRITPKDKERLKKNKLCAIKWPYGGTLPF